MCFVCVPVVGTFLLYVHFICVCLMMFIVLCVVCVPVVDTFFDMVYTQISFAVTIL